jgi:WD40 repeat protein
MKTPDLADQEDITEQPILELSATTQLSDYVSAIAWSPIGNTFAAACCNGEVHLLQNFVGVMLCPPTDNSIDALAFSHDGKWLAAGGLDVLWQAAVEAVQVLDGAEEGFCCLAWHPTGCRLAAGGRRGELFVWSVCG